MKKLFGVMILAGFPVACGSVLPSATDVSDLETTGQAGVSALGNRTAPTGCEARLASFRGITVTVASTASGSAWLRAEPMSVSDDGQSMSCFVPTWTASGDHRAMITPSSRDRQMALLQGKPGKYTVTARVTTSNGRSASATVDIAIE